MGSQLGKRRRRRRRRVRVNVGRLLLILVLLAAVIFLSVLLVKSCAADKTEEEKESSGFISSLFGKETPTPSPLATVAPTPTPVPTFSPSAVAGTMPSDFGLEEAIEDNGTVVDAYTRAEPIDFLEGDTYTELEGVITFRGNNFRDSAAYGTVTWTGQAAEPWTFSVGSMAKKSGSGSWTGCGWTGQPLIVKWPEETKRIMNLYDSAKNDPDLVEVIYATMDGHIYFLDLYTGEKTRDPINVGYPFKGAGALDPRGYPLMYVGSGDDSTAGDSRAFIINLINGTVLYEFGVEDGFALRDLSYFDSSALVDAETDTLIYPGESGILYTIKLNTQYDPNAGTISINPQTVKWRYKGARSLSTDTVDGSQGWWLGIEDSAIIWREHAIFTDNGGHMICLDLNTMKAVWVQDTLDDSNSTPVLEIENGHLYLYVSTSFRLGWRSNDSATIPIWKIDAETGEIIWHTDYECYTDDGVSGGVQSTIACGKNSLSDYIYVTVSKTSDNASGVLACLKKSDGSKAWEDSSSYAWSSPVCVYNEDGTGKVLYCNSTGDVRLLDGKTGELNDTLSISDGVIEASPAVYDNMAVVGTRDCKIWGIELQ